MTYTIAVRALCEFTAKAGDLDLRFTPSPTALEGMEGHRLVTARRAATYETELTLLGTYQLLTVRGRADGYDPALNRLEEIKTYRGDLNRQPANHRHLHWAQVKVYGWLLCQQRGLADIECALVYFDIISRRETVLTQMFAAAELEEFFQLQCQQFLAWATQELAHRQARDRAMVELRFPYPAFRTGQRSLAEAVYKSVCMGHCLMAQAPTGIGKSIGTLFPVLKALPTQELDKVFYLTAKTPGRQLALGALETLTASNTVPLRALELIAREKACEYPDKSCHGESCPLARGFYDRLPAARQAALSIGPLDQAALRALAREHQVCPYYLGQEMARWCDVIIGDYNYYFDLSALLYSLTVAHSWRVAVLVDEAHNLIDRGRTMYSAVLDRAELQSVRRSAPAPLQKPLNRVHRCWSAFERQQADTYATYAELPGDLWRALQQAVTALADHFAEQPTAVDPLLQTFFFNASHWCRLAETFGEHTVCDLTLRPGQRGRAISALCLRNIMPAPYLQPRFVAARSVTLFSATLNPHRFYRDLLGLPETLQWVDVESPFHSDQLAVHIVDHISTRYAHRAGSVAPIVQLMGNQFMQRPGNYLAFLSSFDYLQQVADAFAAAYPEIPHWRQTRRMDEAARTTFMEEFAANGRGIGFAVLGGAFGEGIDLPGDRLIGAFIATLGLPQVNPVNETIKQQMDHLMGPHNGYDYTYFYPGIRKVVQAAGRVIRTPTDRGAVFLIDDRFAERRVQNLLPAWWSHSIKSPD
jgi:DNA excision repair protein ERCC-2